MPTTDIAPPEKAEAVTYRGRKDQVRVYSVAPELAFQVRNEENDFYTLPSGKTIKRVSVPPFTMKFVRGRTFIGPLEACMLDKTTPATEQNNSGKEPEKGDFWYGIMLMTANDLAERWKKKAHKGFVKEMWRKWGIAGVHNTETVGLTDFTDMIHEELKTLKLL